jgi:hypothetical protein|tara:strand:- start:231 stop:1475 length:1245 start_codon:yes stop_codon:yes gene_type:complete
MEYTTRDYFIPFTREQITKMLLDEGKLNNDEVSKFEQFCLLLKSIYHFEFHTKLERLKASYRIFSPEINLAPNELENSNTSKIEADLTNKLRQTLIDGNFEKVSQEDLNAAMEKEGIFPVSCKIDFDSFDYYEIYYQGSSTAKEEIKTWNPFKKKEVEFNLYDRIVFFFKVKNEEFFHANKKNNEPGIPGKIYIKYFRNIPESDLEMIFPNPRPEMKFIHKMQIFLPLLAGFGVLIQKTIIGPYYNAGTNPLEGGFSLLTKPSYPMIALLIVLGGYVLRTFLGYKNVVQSFLGEIAKSLYFKDKGNNQGVFTMLIDSAEEEECKEAMMAYYFLLNSNKKMSEETLDNAIEEWMEEKHKVKIDFEVDDAIKKLEEKDLLSRDKKGILTVVSLDEALNHLDYIWDNYFDYNKPENI